MAESLRGKKILLQIPSTDLPDASPRYFWAGKTNEIIVWREGAQYRAFRSLCPHMGGQLQLNGTRLRCPWHPLSFDTNTCESGHSRYARVECYEAILEGEDLVIYEAKR